MGNSLTKTEQKAKVQPKPKGKEKEYPGICSNCSYADSCMFLKASKQPIWQCEEYDAMSDNDKEVRKNIPQSPKAKKESKKAKNLKGLCVNCANRESCTLPKPEGGVWHCEEYQ